MDDEDGVRQCMRVIFEDEYDLFLAADGPTAIELAKQNDIDVAVTDLRMAGMSGIEVPERLKSLKPDIEMIIMTAYESADTRRQALRLGAMITSTCPATARPCVPPSARRCSIARSRAK